MKLIELKNLKELRNRIDMIDDDILNLIISRQKTIADIYRYKRDNNIPIHSLERENEVLSKINAQVDKESSESLKLLFGVLMDLHKFDEYLESPKEFTIPTDIGGASIRAIISGEPGALCRYLSPLVAAGVSVSDIHSKSLPGGNLVVDIELVGDNKNPRFTAAISVLSDTATKFTLL